MTVLLDTYHSVKVIQNETLNCRIMLFRRTQKLRKRWLAMMTKKDFTPTSSHRVCSNNVPAIVLKIVKQTERPPRRKLNSTEKLRRFLPHVMNPDDLTKSAETETKSDLTQQAIL